jgi:predicted ATPase
VLVVDLAEAKAAADDAVAARARREIRLLGGSLGEEGPHVAVGVFGGSVAWADAAERAVRAALRVADAIDDLHRPGVAVRAAVHTGTYQLTSGDAPPDDAVRVAATLSTSGGVVVDAATHDETQDLFEYEPVDDHAPAWGVRTARGTFGVDFELNLPTPFIGRDHELALLTDIYARVLMESAPHVVTIVGAAGTGKSRLLSEFWNVLDGRPELVFWRQGRSLGDGDGVTLWALGEVVKGQAGILESDDLRTASGKLHVTLRNFLPDGDEARRIGELLGPLAGLIPDDPRPVPWSESFPAWLRFLEAVAATHPIVLVFEDLHLADPGTLAFVRFVSERVARVPMLVVCTARVELLDRDLPGTVRSAAPHATAITLGPLSERDTRELVAGLGGPVDASGTPPVDLLHAAGGNPLYVEGYVRLLDERPDPDAGRPPATLGELMAARLDALGPALRSLTEDAAVVGKVFWPGALEAIGNRGSGEVDEGLAELRRRQLVRPARRSSVGGQAEHAFWHLALRDAALEHMDPGRRGAAHRAAVEWAARMGGDRFVDHAEILAYHAARAVPRPTDDERRFLRLAADRAVALDPGRAADLYERAAALAPEDSPERADLDARAAGARAAAGT